MNRKNEKITVDMVERVYNGRPGCACGCRGTYSDSKRSISSLLKKFEAIICIEVHEIPESPTSGRILYWDSSETRTHTIYLKKEKE